MNGNDRDYLLDRLEDILHDNHCLEYKDEICNSLCKYITSNNRELKPFNLEDAKAGKLVCTRDGRKARIICFDLKDKDRPIVAAIRDNCMFGNEYAETLFCYSIKGVVDERNESDEDLMMLEKEKWAIVLQDNSGYNYLDSNIFITKEAAEKFKRDNSMKKAEVVKLTIF